MIVNDTVLNLINSPVRKIGGEVINLSSDTSYKHNDNLIKFTIERVGNEAKFFGFGISQKLNFHLRDPDRSVAINAGQEIAVQIENSAIGGETSTTYTITEVHRDENTNELSITAYDIIHEAANHNYGEIQETTEISIRQCAEDCLAVIGATLKIDSNLEEAFSLTGEVNLEGTELIRDVLDDIAEATQTVYYVCGGNEVVFKRLDRDGEPAYIVDKSKYITLNSKTNRRLGKLVSATSLGDNYAVETDASGTTQYIRDNVFWDLREDRDTLLEDAFEVVKGMLFNQFDCSWRGNWLLEPGDKIGFITKDNSVVSSYLINDTITYDGSLSQRTKWEYTNSDTEEADNPTNLGDVLKQTYAKVDKINKEINIVAAEVGNQAEDISSLKLDTQSINASVQSTQKSTESAIEGINSDIETLTKRVDSTITAEAVEIQIQNALTKGTTEITTTTGFTFNEEGLTVAKSGSEMTTQITEDGMKVFKNNTPMLTANNEGVEAVNLFASTFLVVGRNSRFEDFDTIRTGCFWIGN